MKTPLGALGQRLVLIFFIPVVLLFSAMSVWMYTTASSHIRSWVQLEISNIKEINATKLSGQINSVRYAVLSMADIFEHVNYSCDNPREYAEMLAKSLFVNETIYNVLFVFESQAFDDRDSDTNITLKH
ncbi:MAG: hypothetical protein FWE27_05065 [Defluviitaleaceae bacterium]|nr:hypothetical protein [Defluviitaleaceae bacterium]